MEHRPEQQTARDVLRRIHADLKANGAPTELYATHAAIYRIFEQANVLDDPMPIPAPTAWERLKAWAGRMVAACL